MTQAKGKAQKNPTIVDFFRVTDIDNQISEIKEWVESLGGDFNRIFHINKSNCVSILGREGCEDYYNECPSNGIIVRDGETEYLDKGEYFILDNKTFESDYAEIADSPSESRTMQDLMSAFQYYIAKNNFRFVNQMMLLFNEESNVGELKAVLVITKAFQDHELIRKNRQRVKDCLQAKVGKIS